MRSIHEAEWERMVEQSETGMFDTGVVLARTSGSPGDLNTPVYNYTSGSPGDCAYDPRSSTERRTFEMVQGVFDATARVPLGTSILDVDRFKITHLKGNALSPPLEYAMNGDPLIRPTYLLLMLRDVQP